jgi:hypothetical protein
MHVKAEVRIYNFGPKNDVSSGFYIYIVHSVVFLKLFKRYKESNTTHQLFVKKTDTNIPVHLLPR